MDYAFGVSSSNRSKNRLSGRNRLELDNILIWEVSSHTFRTYMISIQADNADRVMISDQSREASIILSHQRNGCSIRFCSVATMMSEEERACYNNLLEQEEYEDCLDNLMVLETSLNKKHGFKKMKKVGKTYRR